MLAVMLTTKVALDSKDGGTVLTVVLTVTVRTARVMMLNEEDDE